MARRNSVKLKYWPHRVGKPQKSTKIPMVKLYKVI